MRSEEKRKATRGNTRNITPAQTTIYNTLTNSASISRGNTQKNKADESRSTSGNFLEKRMDSIKNALGTTGAAIASFVNDANENADRENREKKYGQSLDNIVKKYGFNSKNDFWDAYETAENTGDKAKLESFKPVVSELQSQTKRNFDEETGAGKRYEDYRNNDYISKKINQDRGKFAGSAINTLSTGFDVMMPGAGVVANTVQGGVEGVADELEQNGLENFDWERAGQNALIGATSGAAVGGVNKGVSAQLAKNGGNLFKGSNKLTKGINELGSGTTTGQIASTLATGAGRGALSGAVGGATGGGLSAALNNQDILQGALQGATQGAREGAVVGGAMAGANMAFNKTPVGKAINQANEDWQNSGDNTVERWKNTLENDNSLAAELIKNPRGALAEIGNKIQNSRLGNLGNRIENVPVDKSVLPEDIQNMQINDNMTTIPEVQMAGRTVSAEAPETKVYRALAQTAEQPRSSQWDAVSQEFGFKDYADATNQFKQANPNMEASAQNIMDWVDRRMTTTPDNTVTAQDIDAKQRLKDVKAESLRDRAAKNLLNQVSTATAPAARADNMVENVKKFMDEGLTKPEEWQLASDAITGANGVMSKLYRNLISEAGEIDTFSGLGGKYGVNLDDTIDYYIRNAGLTGNEAKGVKNEILGVIESLPSRAEGSLSMADSAEDVMGAIRKLEARKRNYKGEDSRNHQNADPKKDAKAEVLGNVASMLEGKIYEKVPDATKVVTPEAVQELKSYFPNNEKWVNSVEDKFANIKTGKDLRAAQKRYVQTSDYLTNARKNYGTYGQRVGDAYGNVLSQSLKKVPLVGGFAAQIADTPFMNRRYADINTARADRLEGKPVDLPSSTKVRGNNSANMGEEMPVVDSDVLGTENTPVAQENVVQAVSSPATQLYNAIGRMEGGAQRNNQEQLTNLSNSIQTAKTNESKTLEDLLAQVGDYASQNTDIYNTFNGMTATPESNANVSQSGNPYFEATGDMWTDAIGDALAKAIDENNVDLFSELYSMYQDALSKSQKSAGKDYSNPTNWNSADRTKLLNAQNGLGQIDELESAYNAAVAGTGGTSNAFQGGLRSKAAEINSNWDPTAANYNNLAQSAGMGIVKNLVNLGVTEADAQRYLQYLPSLGDTREQAASKLQTLRNIYQNQIDNLYSIYEV